MKPRLLIKSAQDALLRLVILVALTFFSFGQAESQVYEKVFSFTDAAFSQISQPNGVILGSDGNFYGTSRLGGSSDSGTIFRISPSGVVTTLVNFTGTNGLAPIASLIQASDGNFYGVTQTGGSSGNGTVFRCTTAGILTTLVNFSSTTGSNPYGGLIQATDGNFYGTTLMGGTVNNGTVFKVTPAGVLTTLANFNASTTGASPYASLVQGTDGNFYGTTGAGGDAQNDGTIFKITPAGVLTNLVNFTGTNGSAPIGGLIQGTDGNFYGGTRFGGTTNEGVLFKMTPAGVLTVLHNCAGATGSQPISGLLQGSDGNFYGSTFAGGVSSIGVFFKMTSTGDFTTLLSFNGPIGANAYGSLAQGTDGNFYGSTYGGGDFSNGTVYRITKTGQATAIASFHDNIGYLIGAGLTEGDDGNLYGTSSLGGTYNLGTLFKITPSGVLTNLYNFADYDGARPIADLIKGSDGSFYGTTSQGGTSNNGTVFKITQAGALTTLVNFNGTNGTGLLRNLLLGRDGFFYGVTAQGGTSGNGTIFRMAQDGTLLTLYNFSGTDGSLPHDGLIQGSDNTIYGTTNTGGTSNLGTIFKISSPGSITTLVNFNGTNGSNPLDGMIVGADGNFYGTTANGGSSGKGTIYKMTPAGVLTTFFAFTGANGAYPYVGLFLASDGNFYGETDGGGQSNYGTVFKITPAGTLTTLYDFANDPVDSNPQGHIMQASDGNIYGTSAGSVTAGGLGCIFRLVLTGKPTVALNPPSVQSQTSALFTLTANARGSTSTVTLLYGTDGINFPNSVPIALNLSGYKTTQLGTTLTNLNPGTIYYYKVSATNSSGTTTTAVQSFSTLAPPTTLSGPASNILPTSATFNGVVNAQNYSTTVTFQYGTDGNTFPNSVTAVPASVIGTSNTTVSAAVAGLSAGTTYYYRISATNIGGTTVSGVSIFSTLMPPVETVLPASLVTSQSAQFNGTVNANGASTAVTFEYGTDNVSFPYTLGGTPSPVTGATATNVSATISNSAGTPLVQGTTYYYRVRGTSLGGTTVSSTLPFSLDVLSGFARQFPNPPAPAQGFVLVNLTPSGLNSGWRFAGEQLWRPAGVPAFGLVTGNYTIQYEPVPGYIQPAPETISVTSGGAATILNREYYPASGGDVGGLDVVLQPAALADSSVPAVTRAQWRFYGENDSQWRDSGTTVSNLAPGNYLLECKPVLGQTTPAIASVTVSSGQTALPTLTYFVSGNPTGAQPVLLPFSTVTNSATPTQPYAFVGQIRSDVGSSTGFVVKSRVVATAGHVVFDDGSLAYVTGLQWLFQRYAGTYEPVPQIPTGFYVFDGYATQRMAEHTPGVSSPASQNLDVAAMYFQTSAGNGGYSGYLGSDANTNEFLVSSRSKMLVGYPVDGIPLANDGQMYATASVTATFTQVNGNDSSGDPATSGKPYRVYTTTGLSSVGGNSGGPLCVQFDDGNYYPTAIYLGGSAQTVVRSIDSPVIDLFNRADVSGNGGGNNTGGGITQVNTTLSGNGITYGAIKVTLLPATASGATWRLGPSAVGQSSGATLSSLLVQHFSLYLSTVPGFLTPPLLQSSTLSPKPNFDILTIAGQLSNITYTYEGITSQPQNLSASAGGSATFTVGVSGAPTAYQWRRSGTNISGATSASYTISTFSASDAGTYDVVVTWGTDGFQTSSPAALNLGGSSQISFTQWQTTYGQTGGANATPQHDGVPNLLKYLYDINPTHAMTTADKTALPVVGLTTSSGTSYLTLTYRQNANITGVTVNVQTSTDLSTWSSVTSPNLLSQQVGTDISTGDPLMQVGVKATGAARYIRLNVTSP